MRNRAPLALAAAIAPCAAAQSPFATRVVSYDPAPGQFTTDPGFSDPARALGPPTPGTPSTPDNTGLVTLGGFTGSITLAFDHTVEDDPNNPMGLDAIIFANAFYIAGEPTRRSAEAGTIEIALDTNHNNLPDDPFYLIPGSSLAPPLSPPFQLTGPPFTGPAAINSDPTTEQAFGYADWTPSRAPSPDDDPTTFFTTPDDPFTVGISEGSAGGDAFDIAWAIDPATARPANLPGFDFIRITTAVDETTVFGEKSTEIDAISDVAPAPPACPPDLNNDASLSGADFNAFLTAFASADPRADLNNDANLTGADFNAFLTLFSQGCP